MCVVFSCVLSHQLGKGLTFWLFCVLCFIVFCHFPIWCPRSAVLYPYSTQATNRPNRHEFIFFLFGGIREVSFFFSNRDELRVIPDSDTMSLRIFGGIGSIRLESRKNSLRLENNIRTWCTEVKESITNQLRICEMQHELGTK